MSLNREQPMRPFLDELADALENYEIPQEQVISAVNTVLAAHPEWTTTVQDGSITGPKIANDTIPDAKLAQTGGVLSAVKSMEYVENCAFVRELYINEAGRSAGVTKLHAVYVESGGSPSFFLRFSNGSTFTGHTEATSTPDYGILTIYSGITGTSETYGYVIVDWAAVSATYSPIADIREVSYKVDCSPRIASLLGVEVKANDLSEQLRYSKYELVVPNFQMVTTDYNLEDVTDTANRFATTDAFFCKGHVRIDLDPSIVGIGLRLFIMSVQSGRNSQWATNVVIDSASYVLDFDDTIRIAIYNANGVSPQYNTIVDTTCIYTMKDADYFEYLDNKIIGSKNIWCFGDSLTAGVITGSTTITESYPYYLKRLLGNESVAITNYGVAGYNAVNLLSLVSGMDFYNCDIAVLMIGTNGYMNGDPSDPTTMLGAYYATIEHIINSGKGRTKIVLINPPKSIRSGVPTRWLDAMHYKEQQVAEHFNLDMIDLYDFLPFAPDNTLYYSSDQTHFTNVGYYYIAYVVYKFLTTHMTAEQVGGNPTFDY